MGTEGYRELEVWQLGIALVERCYHASRAFPKTELYGLAGQLRRAAVSIPANIAEGHNRRTTKAYLNHVNIALGSQGELDTLLEVAARFGYLGSAERNELVKQVGAMARLLHGLRRALESKLSSGRGFAPVER